MLELLGDLHWAICTTGAVACALLTVGILVRRSVLPAPAPPPPVSILKPFDGSDPDLADNFQRTADALHEGELLFATSAEGPGAEAARAVRTEHPVRVLLPDPAEPPWITRKAWHLHRAAQAARFDVLVGSDSGTRPSAEALRAAVSLLAADPRCGAVYAPYAISGDGLGAELVRSMWTAGATCFACSDATAATLRRKPFLAGGLVAMRRAAWEQAGGEALEGYLTEDVPLGHRMHDAGWTVRLSPVAVERHVPGISLLEAARRQVRWAAILWRFRQEDRHPYPLFLCNLAIVPFTWVLAVAAFPHRLGEYSAAVGLLVAARFAFGAFLRSWVLRRPFRLLPLLLMPVGDAVLLWAWVRGAFVRVVVWRGVRLRLGEQGRVERA